MRFEISVKSADELTKILNLINKYPEILTHIHIPTHGYPSTLNATYASVIKSSTKCDVTLTVPTKCFNSSTFMEYMNGTMKKGLKKFLIVSGDNPNKDFTTIDALKVLQNNGITDIDLSVVVNPFTNGVTERVKLEEKLVSNRNVSSVIFQLGYSPSSVGDMISFIDMKKKMFSRPIRTIGSVVYPHLDLLNLLQKNIDKWDGISYPQTFLNSVDKAIDMNGEMIDKYESNNCDYIRMFFNYQLLHTYLDVVRFSISSVLEYGVNLIHDKKIVM